MSIKSNIKLVNDSLLPSCRLIAVSKTKPNEQLMEAYEAGQRLFGENKVQELEAKYQALPKDIEWHMIGHLQTNKVKYIAPFVSLIHSVDSVKLLEEINKQGKKINRVIPCLLQVYIAKEETKFGLDEQEVLELVQLFPSHFTHVSIQGLMGMATHTDNPDQIRAEFKSLKNLFDRIALLPLPSSIVMKELSMGMSSDYTIAMEEGSTLVRIGSTIFGERNYATQP
ncbi:MAG: YggS family pyridoxal phosphate-dependent enzyme [Cyclobacteriaceae bacterium]|nr:YggS family pyridoxal phosphate-dependent enzyme [Cyclobacteriaceae bacterium]